MINFAVPIRGLVIAFSTILLLVACKPPVTITDSDVPCEPSSIKNTPESINPLKISVNIDGSGSMYGYVKNNPNSRYVKTINLLDSVLNVGSHSKSEVNIEYYRVGETQTQKIDSSQYQQAKFADFYTGTNPQFPQVSSNLDVAITEPDNQEDQLLILVTDLDQNGVDFNKLNKKIQDTYLNSEHPGYAVGILGVKSEYNHTVYSIDKKIYEDFIYNTAGKDLEGYRPFYVVFLGTYQDIVHYFEKMKAKDPDLINSSKFTIFYPDKIVNQIATLQNFPDPPEDIIRPFSLQQGNLAVEVKSPPYELLEIDSKIDNQNPTINYNVPVSFLKYTAPIALEAIETNIEVFNYDFTNKTFTQTNNSSLDQALQLTNWQTTENSLKFTTEINLNSFPSSGIYLFKFNAIAKDLQEEEWWKQWDWDSKTSNEDGSKTYNFFNFMDNLKRTTTGVMKKPNNSSIGYFCYAIQKN